MSETEKPKVIVLRRSRGKLKSDVQPIVVEYRERRKKTRKAVESDDEEKYTQGLKDLQRMEGDMVHLARRSAKVVSKGLDTYDEERKRSAKEKKDGAIQDFIDNSAKAMSTSMKEASDIPMDIAEYMNTSSYRKRLRRNLRRASRVIRLFRI
jgi:hypothetical protein